MFAAFACLYCLVLFGVLGWFYHRRVVRLIKRRNEILIEQRRRAWEEVARLRERGQVLEAMFIRSSDDVWPAHHHRLEARRDARLAAIVEAIKANGG